MKDSPTKNASDSSLTRTRKRPRPSTTEPDGTNEVEIELTPHTWRLLKLIEEGTQEYAKLAATHLVTVVAQSSPLILWDILGRLQAYLMSPHWQTRQNASLAILGVAQQLPSQDRKDFFQHVAASHREATTSTPTSMDPQANDWLTVRRILDHLPIILEQGRTLLASAETKYDEQEDSSLQQLDASLQGTKDLVQRRMQLQRAILARRLGLSPVLSKVSGDAALLDTVVSNDDLLPNLASTTQEPKQPGKRHKATMKENSNSTKPPAFSLRSILVSEIHLRQQNTDTSSKSTSSSSHLTSRTVSHKTAQCLLATELVYRMFDASWYVRHGSLMGLLALLKAWRISQEPSHKANLSEQQQLDSSTLFGSWPHDILSRVLCVLALDRFADYSETSILSKDRPDSISSDSGGGIVSPVREVAGQVLSMLFLMAPRSVQEQVYGVLQELVRQQKSHEDWEIRYGALVAARYLTIAILQSTSTNDCTSAWTITCLRNIFGLAQESLSDPSDDVQGMAARLVTALMFAKNTPLAIDWGEERKAIVAPLWKAIQSIDLISSAIKDLISLFAALLDYDFLSLIDALDSVSSTKRHVVEDLFGLLTRLSTCPFLTARIAIVKVMGGACQQLSRSWCQLPQEYASSPSQRRTAKSFCSLTLTLFRLYFSRSIEVDGGVDKDSSAYTEACYESWVQTTEASLNILREFKDLRHGLEKTIILSYFCIGTGHDLVASGKWKDEYCAEASFGPRRERNEKLAAVVSAFLIVEGEDGPPEESQRTVEFCLHACLESPFLPHYEKACLLLAALARSGKESMPHAVIGSCKSILTKTDQDEPLCLRVDRQAMLDISDMATDKIVTAAFCRAMEQSLGGNIGVDEAVNFLRLFWSKTSQDWLKSKSTQAVNVDTMRMSALSAGVLVCGGLIGLPEKLTPIVRALMTSVQNEKDTVCQEHTCTFLSNLVLLLGSNQRDKSNEAHTRTFEKILKNLVKMVVSNRPPSCKTATSIVGTIVKSFSCTLKLDSIRPLWDALTPLLTIDCVSTISPSSTINTLLVLRATTQSLTAEHGSLDLLFERFIAPLTFLSSKMITAEVQELASECLLDLCKKNYSKSLRILLPNLAEDLLAKDDNIRKNRCSQLKKLVDDAGMSICPFVKVLLPLSMSLMTDPVLECSRQAACVFSKLVQLAPLVSSSVDLALHADGTPLVADKVISHLINGQPLPPCNIHPKVSKALAASGVELRPYQMEGISWLRFLQSLRLNGALTDAMGLGKTLQSLIGIALSHFDAKKGDEPKSLVVCPTSVVGHWMQEINRFFKHGEVFVPFCFLTSTNRNKNLSMELLEKYNIVVTSYATLRSECAKLSSIDWWNCVLDEGHLLKNPKTATAISARSIRARHKLILTGTPVQNKVHEVWATFDFLMPNFLGSSRDFSKDFARPITKGQAYGASARDIATGMEKLKSLHQQVLPFILRREKEQVLKDLPPKTITKIPCEMSAMQLKLYSKFCSGEVGRRTLRALRKALDKKNGRKSVESLRLESDVLKALLYLRLLCTHPILIAGKSSVDEHLHNIESSGKFLVLRELLLQAGIGSQTVVAADNDHSLVYIQADEESEDAKGDFEDALETTTNGRGNKSTIQEARNGSKCLIFSQFTHSLDAIEDIVLKPYFGGIRYLRLDGGVPPAQRGDLVSSFNENKDIQILLLTTKVGGLGLNLTGTWYVCWKANKACHR